MGKKSRSSREPRKPKQIKQPENKAGSLADLVKSRAAPPLVGAK
jgi:hypothetical protein